jgi:alpha-amylase/alpha-mannosidase (GH57 family)
MTRVALLWHMHQPFYQDLVTGEHILPWVRLHALKDYFGMVALLREFPDIRVTFNLVPSMLVQIEAFANDEARDRHLDVGLKDAAQLTRDEQAFCLEQFFHAHRPRMIDPYPRYAALLDKRRAHSGLSAHAQAAHFSVEELRDLQVWHKLAWIDPFYLDSDERVRALVDKGQDFSEDDKRILREVELELLRRVVPEYRAAAERGQVELSALSGRALSGCALSGCALSDVRSSTPGKSWLGSESAPISFFSRFLAAFSSRFCWRLSSFCRFSNP